MRRLLLPLVVVAAAACTSPPPRASDASALAARGGHAPHLQIVRAIPTAERAALVQRFRARNGAWTITLGAGGAPDDVDPIRGIVRRATRDTEDAAGAGAAETTEAIAIAEAAAFLGRNAEFLGLAASDVAALDLVAGPAKTSTYGRWVVHATGTSPMRGYEGFEALTSRADILLYIGEGGTTRYFVNLSHVHARLSIDTKPLLGPDDSRLLTNVIGRPLFVAIDDPNRPNARVRELRRVPLGLVTGADVRSPRLTVNVSPGPRFAYVSYALAYAIDVVKDHNVFRFVVDADTGALLEDASVPVVAASRADESD